MAFSSCGFDDYDISYPEKKVLFTYQQYNRQLVVGEGLKLKVGFVFSGLPENDRDRLVNFTVDPDLVPGTMQLLPYDYYTLGNDSEIIIPEGVLKAYLDVKLDSSKFVNDPKALTGEYVLPVRILDADADEIAAGKEYTVISVSYLGHQFGNYTSSGKRRNSAGVEETYASQSSETNSIRQLQTVSADKFRVYADQTGEADPAKGMYSMIITVPVHGSGEVMIEPDKDYLPDIAVSPDGSSFYDEATRTFILRYKYQDASGVEWTAEDKMVFRNRVRDDQGDGRVLYEWRGF